MGNYFGMNSYNFKNTNLYPYIQKNQPNKKKMTCSHFVEVTKRKKKKKTYSGFTCRRFLS